MSEIQSGMEYIDDDGNVAPVILSSSVVSEALKTQINDSRNIIDHLSEIVIGLKTCSEG